MNADRVLDASVTLAWLFREEKREAHVESLMKHTFATPWLWRLEVVNAILIRERRKLVTHSDAVRYFRALGALDIETIGEPRNRNMEELASLARPHQLTAYDAVYLELAMTLNLPLVTLDRNLQEAAHRLGIELIT